MKITNERLEKLSGEVRNIKKSQKFTQKQLKDEANVIKKDVEILQKKSKLNRKGSLRPWGYYK